MSRKAATIRKRNMGVNDRVFTKERRRLTRNSIDQAGKILVPTGTILECSVRNITGLGMCIYLDHVPDDVSEALDFSFDNFRTIHRCKVSWRHGNLIGIAFQDEVWLPVSRSMRARVRLSSRGSSI